MFRELRVLRYKPSKLEYVMFHNVCPFIGSNLGFGAGEVKKQKLSMDLKQRFVVKDTFHDSVNCSVQPMRVGMTMSNYK